jgi:hypothetical protein
MTDNRATQVSLEEFATTNPPAQVTQVALEQWASTGTVTGQALVTQVALEQWALNLTASIGNADGQATVAGVGAVANALPTTGRADGQATVAGVGGRVIVLPTVGEADGQASVSGIGQSWPPTPRNFSVIPYLRETTYRRRFLGVSFDPTLVITKERPGPLRIIEVDFWNN